MEYKKDFLYTIERWRKDYFSSRGEKLTNTALAELLGISRVHLQRLLHPEYNIDEKVYSAVGFRYRDWKIQEDTIVHTKKHNDLDTDFNLDQLIPYVTMEELDNYPKHYDDPKYINSLPKVRILPWVDPAGSIWRYFAINDLLMYMRPELEHEDIVLCSPIIKEDWKRIAHFLPCIVVTNQKLFARYIKRQTQLNWVLRPHDKTAKSIEISPSDIKEIWTIRRLVRNLLRISEGPKPEPKAIPPLIRNE